MQLLKQIFLLLIFIISVQSNDKKKRITEQASSTQLPVDLPGIQLGEQVLIELDYQRSLVRLDQSIPRTVHMHELAFEYTKILLKNPTKIEQHPDFNSRAKRFTDKCVYTEFAVILIKKENFAHDAVEMWVNNPKTLGNMKKEYDEAGAYCTNYGNGYICVVTLLNLPKGIPSQ